MVRSRYVDGRAGIDARLVRRLVATQFPQWADLPVTPVEADGHDNRTYRLGEDMTVRLPTDAGYAPAVDKEHRWLPFLAPSLPVPVPVPLAKGAPGEGYPYAWSVRRWLDGEPADTACIADPAALAASVGQFLAALRDIDATGGPRAGAHSFYRGASLAHYDQETRHALAVLARHVDVDCAAAVWETALASGWHGAPVWFHGDVASSNLLVRDGALAAVIDFGTCGTGDPACDLVIAWTFFSGHSREAFRRTVNADPSTWARARGWALWKALIGLAGAVDTDTARAGVLRAEARRILADPVHPG